MLASTTLNKKMTSYRRKVSGRVKQYLPHLSDLVSGAIYRSRCNLFRLREMTGLAPKRADAEESFARFITDAEKHINALPEDYLELFCLSPLPNNQFFAARQAELDMLQEELERWQNGKFTTTALIGERGCGKTTLLNLAEQQLYSDYSIVKIDFLDTETIFEVDVLFEFLKQKLAHTGLPAGCQTIDELEARIIELPEQRVFFVENLQQIFLRTTFGFDALERFLLFVSRTHQKIHWLITCTIYSWEYFAKVLNIDEYVHRKIMLDTMPRAGYEEIILKRHKASGRRLRFKPNPEITNSRRFRKLKTEKERQTYLKNLFFQQLSELAMGNITVAILFLLRSYKRFSHASLTLPATIDFNPSFLYQLPAEEHFTLIAFLQHDSLNEEHHALIFHQDVQQSLLLLNRMANKGYLEKNETGYQIHPFLYRPIVRVLKSDNIIH
ncbi:MAG: ATP-binding protein [Chloroflexi bacterium]|nr:MAG: ATP-binding protein [Chloroflexota bacterium]